MSYDYLDDAVAELAARYQVATYQQRGLAPSTEQGEFTVAEAVADIAAVLDGLGWETAYLMGHSWGGHLVFHAAAGIPERLAGVLSVDPLGAVGDGGAEAFGAEMLARVPEADRERARTLDEKDTAGEATPEERHEAFALFWPSYFADPAAAPADAAHGVLPAGEPGAVGRSADPAARARVVATVDHGPVRRARRRAEPDAAERRHARVPTASLAPGRTSSRGRATSSGSSRPAVSWLRWIGSSRAPEPSQEGQRAQLTGPTRGRPETDVPATRGAERRLRRCRGGVAGHQRGRRARPRRDHDRVRAVAGRCAGAAGSRAPGGGRCGARAGGGGDVRGLRGVR